MLASDSSQPIFTQVSPSGPSLHPVLGFCSFVQHLTGKYHIFLEKNTEFDKENIFLTLYAVSNLGVCGGNVGLTTIWPWKPCIKGS